MYHFDYILKQKLGLNTCILRVCL